MISFEAVIGAWISVLLTLAIFSYLYRDNPFYKAAEHIFVGVSAGYWAATFFWTQVHPNLFGRLWPVLSDEEKGGILLTLWYLPYHGLRLFTSLFGYFENGVFPKEGIVGWDGISFSYVIPLFLGIFMLLRLVPKLSWMARWAIAYIVGMAAGLRFYGFLNSDIIEQIKASTININDSWSGILNSLIVIIGTLTGLLYFFFSRSDSGMISRVSKIGIYFLMISFGASFGFAVMGRISLLIGRFNELIKFSNADYYHASFWLLSAMIVLLGIWAFSEERQKEEIIS